MTPLEDIRVIAPNFKRRLSGVTATVVRLVPVQAREIGIVATGPVLPPHVPQIPLRALITLPRGPLRVWHARRNVEMIGGLALKYLGRKRLKLMFTSASQRRQSGLTRWLIRRMDAVVATSDKTAAYLEVPSTVIVHGIDTDTFAPAPDRTALRTTLNLPQTGPLIGCYGRIRAQKGTDAFVRAMIAVCADHPTACAVVMGRAVGTTDAAYLDALKSDVAKARLANRILFKPEVPTEAMADWYAALDLYVAPQRWEGFGLTPIEAMATGCPVIATRVGAFEQIIEPGTGRLVAPDDIPALGQAINDAIARPAELVAWRANARIHAAENFSITREARSLIALYNRLLG